MSARRVALHGVVFLAGGFAACAGSEAPRMSTLPVFTDADSATFDDGVDLVRDPQGVGGMWQQEWERELGERVTRADYVVVAFVHTLHSDEDLERRTSYRLVARVDRTLSGATPQGDITLVSREDATGYVSVQGNHETVLEQSFVVFARHFRDASGRTVTHWHLSPASDAVVRQVQRCLEQQAPTFREVRVIERRE